MTSATTVRYAVVGLGWISQAAFMPAVAQTGNSAMAALVSGDADKLRVLAERYGIARCCGYDDYPALLRSGDIDAVYLALPNAMHRDYAVAALNAGIHVLLEKPMATSEADCRAINDAARGSGAKLMIAYRLHFEPATLDALRRVRAGEIGEPLVFSSVFSQHVSTQNHRAKGGYWAGPVPDMGTYPINAARMLFGSEPTRVSATGAHAAGKFQFHDTVSVTMRFPGDKLAQFVVSYAGAAINQYRLLGAQGDIALDPGFTFGGQTGLGQHRTVNGTTESQAFPATDQFGGQLRYFSDCILNDRDPEPDGQEGLADMRILAAIEKALETGQPQTLPPFDRHRQVEPAQAVTLPPVVPPPLVNAAEPGG